MEEYNQHINYKIQDSWMYRAATATAKTIGRPFNRALDEVAAFVAGDIFVGTLLDMIGDD